MCEDDLYRSGEVGCGAVITLETGGDNWRGQSQHTILFIAIKDSINIIIPLNHARLTASFIPRPTSRCVHLMIELKLEISLG